MVGSSVSRSIGWLVGQSVGGLVGHLSVSGGSVRWSLVGGQWVGGSVIPSVGHSATRPDSQGHLVCPCVGDWVVKQLDGGPSISHTISGLISGPSFSKLISQ